ncbi:ABC transporter substrate-binding protein [Streptomyces sp. V4-01]|uniref:ABC transporter substrate-binding protein n=1 Tax=Actinacidiphila polyblastidii TaxID=3110430 RepID=A0ABU7PHA9_9ACTN|nr:ABC transporter substrate-binding protein [Streptomyces sp. V4-01]
MTRAVCGALVLALLLAVAGCGAGPRQQRVTIMVPWSDGEFQAFYSVVKEFESATGVHVDIEVARAMTQQLDAAAAAGVPPDLAVLPSVGAIDQYVQAHRLQPLHLSTADYAQPFGGLASVRGTVYALPVKADVKSLVWYSPSASRDGPPPTGPAALEARSRKDPAYWCLGLASGPTSGLPGADWIADIILAQGGVGPYEQWLSGGLPWTAPQVVDAWQTWRKLVGPSISSTAARLFASAGSAMTADPPPCRLGQGTMATMGYSANLRPGTDYDFVTPSAGHRLEVSADFVGMFTTDNPAARRFLTYLSGPGAQRAWVGADEGYGFSALRQVALDAYRNPVQRRIAAMLQPGSGWTLCFAAADTMRPDVSAAFSRAVLTYTADPTSLKDLLGGLRTVQDNRGDTPVPQDKLCAVAR